MATTTVLVGGAVLLIWLGELWSPLQPLGLLWCLVLIFAPFFLVPLHFRWQSPAESSVLLAFATGLGSWALTWFIGILISFYNFGP